MSNVEIIRELYDAFSRRDTDTIRDLMHPQIEWVQTQGFPGGDRYVGPDEVFDKVFAPFREQWTEWGADVDDYLDAGDRVIALGFYRGVYVVCIRPLVSEWKRPSLTFTRYTMGGSPHLCSMRTRPCCGTRWFSPRGSAALQKDRDRLA